MERKKAYYVYNGQVQSIAMNIFWIHSDTNVCVYKVQQYFIEWGCEPPHRIVADRFGVELRFFLHIIIHNQVTIKECFQLCIQTVKINRQRYSHHVVRLQSLSRNVCIRQTRIAQQFIYRRLIDLLNSIFMPIKYIDSYE